VEHRMLFEFEEEGVICGIDEAGRGPLAGPVVAACVVLGPTFPVEILADSKKLSIQQREKADTTIKEHALHWAVASVSAKVIDQINILEASMLAMERAYAKVRAEVQVARALVDGNRAPQLDCTTLAVVRGDDTHHPIMAASIVAKVYRDHLMQLCATKWPYYGFESHKGYPTEAHRQACLLYGLSPIHRRSFAIKRSEGISERQSELF
jgi:ribonuclease HII